VPAAADSVIMQEQVQADGHNIHFPAHTASGKNIREIGEDIKQGGLLLTHPKKLTAIDLGLLASAGIAELSVKRPVKIAFFSTGDELTALVQPLESGKIYDSNRYLLSGLLADPNYQITDLGVIADNKQLLEECVVAAAKQHDVIISTGGASVGDADYVKEILEHCGEIDFWKIAIKPGKPLAFGKIGDCYFFGLPGNPVAVVVTFQHIIAPALKQLSGAPTSTPLQLTATCTTALKKSPSSGRQGSNILSSMSRANCYIILATECAGIVPGDKVRVQLIQNTEIV
jgi:molybdopterin molybdotransferase